MVAGLPRLLPPQKLLDRLDLVRTQRAEPALVVDENHLRLLKMDHHVWSMISVDIHEGERDWYQVGVGSVELWAEVDASVGNVPTR